jgi:N-methylhydantoinase B
VPSGRYEIEVALTDDGYGTEGVSMPIAVAMTFDGDELHVDLTGTAPQVDSAINLPLSNTEARVLTTLHQVLGGDTPFNAGFIRPIHISTPPRTVLNPEFPAATGGRGGVSNLIRETVFRVLAMAVPDRVPVPPSTVDIFHFAGRRPSGQEFQVLDVVYAGLGARPHSDGIDGAGLTHFGGIPVELLERDAPVVVEQFDVVPDTGGRGQYRGGLSVAKRFRFLEDASVTVWTSRFSGDGFGLAGGEPGAPPVNLHIRGDETSVLPEVTHLHLEVKAGDSIYHEMGGQGGYGDPSERDGELIRRDIASGKSLAAAGEVGR